MRSDETLIWDTYLGYRFVRENKKTYFYYQTNDLIKTKDYVTHIGESPIVMSNNNAFVRELYDSTEYMLPPKVAYVDNRLISFYKVNRNDRKNIDMTASSASNNLLTNNVNYADNANDYRENDYIKNDVRVMQVNYVDNEDDTNIYTNNIITNNAATNTSFFI